MEKPRKGLSTQKAIMTGAAIISLSAGLAPEAQAATGSGSISANLLVPIAVTSTQILHFGSFTANPAGTGGVITVDPAGVRTETSAGIELVTGLGLETNGAISLAAGTGTLIDLVIDPGLAADTRDGVTITDGYFLTGTAVVTGTNLGTMVAGNFIIGTVTAGTNSNVGLGTADDVDVNLAAATVSFPVGAQLLVKPNNQPGLYQGTYNITATYQ